jgi:hypothetical protein
MKIKKKLVNLNKKVFQRDRIIKRYQIKNDAFKEKYLKYTKEKRLAEEFYIIKKDRLLVKNLIKSFIRDSFYEKKKTNERTFSFFI